MRLLATLCCSAILLPALALGGLTRKSIIFPEETSTSYVEMIPQKPLSLRAFTLCMRFATELKGEREIILFAYRTPDYDELNVWRELDGRLSFYLSGDGAIFQVPEQVALETYLCVTWESSSGAAALYINGRRSVTKVYKQGHRVSAGGKVILGQDPDNFLGGFDSRQSFVGDISEVNMWDYVLPRNVIRAISCGKQGPKGNIFDWDTIETKINGQVEMVYYEI
ncbi:C-reactive protein-like [Polymixia lowei]